MKAYKIEILIIDHGEIGPEEIKAVIENTKYPNWCIDPDIKKITERDIGEWDDNHPLNRVQSHNEEYNRLFLD